ncbi:hypothetical protein B0H11DRAFT_2423605 [Mycena galericulata]|nr:hypothetical protein B0H11DRAFT_2423605 [Mycena galericulata]
MSCKETTHAWYWAYLIKHPDWYSKVKDVKDRGKHGDKPKVYCKAHFDAGIRAERGKDHQQGAEARTDEAIGNIGSYLHYFGSGTYLAWMNNMHRVIMSIRCQSIDRPTLHSGACHSSNDVITADSLLREVITTVLREATSIVGGEVFAGNPERRHRSCAAECWRPREANSEGGRTPRWDTEGTSNLGNDTKKQNNAGVPVLR